MKLIYVLIFVFYLSTQFVDAQQKKDAKSHIVELKFVDKSPVFSDIAKEGKVSVFIISAHWCKPCKILKSYFNKDLQENVLDSKYVDIYYIHLTKDENDNFKKMNSRQAYRHFKYVDKSTGEFPSVYIYAPTKNALSFYGGAKYKEIFPEIIKLIEITKKYFDKDYLDYQKIHKPVNNNKSLLKKITTQLVKKDVALKSKNLELSLLKEKLKVNNELIKVKDSIIAKNKAEYLFDIKNKIKNEKGINSQLERIKDELESVYEIIDTILDSGLSKKRKLFFDKSSIYKLIEDKSVDVERFNKLINFLVNNKHKKK